MILHCASCALLSGRDTHHCSGRWESGVPIGSHWSLPAGADRRSCTVCGRQLRRAGSGCWTSTGRGWGWPRVEGGGSGPPGRALAGTGSACWGLQCCGSGHPRVGWRRGWGAVGRPGPFLPAVGRAVHKPSERICVEKDPCAWGGVMAAGLGAGLAEEWAGCVGEGQRAAVAGAGGGDQRWQR